MNLFTKTFLLALCLSLLVRANAQTAPGNALYFNGSNNLVSTGNTTVFDLASLTMECWVRRDALNGTNACLMASRSSSSTRFSVHMGDNSVGLWNGAAYNAVTLAQNFAAGKWYHIAMVIKAATADVYVNGLLQGSTTNGMGSSTGLPLQVGGPFPTATSELVNGSMDEVRVWNTQRSAGEILSNMNSTVASNATGLLLYYKFDQGVAGGSNTGITTATDATANGNNGTLSNFLLTGSSSNWVESYAMVIPTAGAATYSQPNAFTANWAAPQTGTTEKYLLDVSTSSTFSSFVTGYNGKDMGTATVAAVTGLANGTYYYRVRAEKASVTGQGGYSATITAAASQAQAPPIYNGAFAAGLGTANNGMFGASVAKDAAGNTYYIGSLMGTNVDFDPSANTAFLSNVSSGGNTYFNSYVAKYNNKGQYVWAFGIGGAGDAYPGAIAVDASGNVYITGYVTGLNINFNPAGTANLSSVSSSDVFVAKYSTSGAYQWAFSMGSSGSDAGISLAVDGGGNLLVGGYFNATVNFNPAGTANLTSRGANDAFIAKYNSSGAYQWAVGMGGTSRELVGGITTDASNNVIITGAMGSTAGYFDPANPTTTTLTRKGSEDIFVAKYTSSGAYTWAINVGSASLTGLIGYSVATDASSNVFVTGAFRGTNVNFNPAGTATISSNGSSVLDAFVAKYSSTGAYQWAFPIGSTGTDAGRGIDMDASGNVIVAGNIAGDADADPSAATYTLTGNGGNDAFIAKYTNAGTLLWAFNMGGTGSEICYGITVDANGKIAATGAGGSTSADFDPSANTANLSSDGTNVKSFMANYIDYNAWLGSNTVWANTANWSYAALPISTSPVIIPVTANQPIIGSGTAATAYSMTIQNGGILTLSGTGTLAASNGITVNAGAALVGNSSNVSGTVTVQQNVIGQRGFRIFANPFSTSQTLSTLASNNNITINTTAQVSGLTDARTYSNSSNSWSNAGTSIASNTSFALFIRGLANEVNGLNYTGGPTAFTYTESGTLNGASVSLTPSNATGNFMLSGNPYAAPVNTQSLTGQVSLPYYTYQITQGSTATAQRTKAGSWVAASSNSSTTATIPVLGVLAYQPSSTSTFNITSSDINTTGAQQGNLFRAAGNGPKQLELIVEQDGTFQDKLFVRLDAATMPSGADRFDLAKLANDNLNVYTIAPDGVRLAVDARNSLTNIPLGINAAQGSYNFKVGEMSLPAGTSLYLKDKLLGTQTTIQEDNTYGFSITADTATKGENRFELVFGKSLPAIAAGPATFSARILGNPVAGNTLTVQVLNSASPVNVVLTQMDGKAVGTYTLSNGMHQLPLKTGAGMYIVLFNNGTGQVTEKLIKY